MKRFGFVFCLVGLFLFSQPCQSESDFNVDFFVGWEGCYRPMYWTPVEIGINSKLTQPFAGNFTISAQQDGLNTMNISQSFVLTPDMPLHMPLVTKIAYAASDCQARLTDQKGRVRWRQNYHLWDYSEGNRMLTPLDRVDLLVGVVGRHQFRLQQLAEETASYYGDSEGRVYIKYKIPRMLAWDWTGYASLDLLLLYDPDWTTINPHQARAISEWVHNGGKLICILGSNPLPAKHALAELIPYAFQQVQQVSLSADFLTACDLDASTPQSVAAWPLSPIEDHPVNQNVSRSDSNILIGNSYVGFGRVGVVAFDPATLSPLQQKRSRQFWVKQIAGLLEDTLPPLPKPKPKRNKKSKTNESIDPLLQNQRVETSVPRALNRGIRLKEVDENLDQNYNMNHYQIDQAQAAGNAVMDHLYNISEMRPLSIWWVILLLGSLAILLGPIDYIVLKKLDRLPLTWVTSTFWIVLFSVGAYYGVQSLRSGSLQLRAVSVVDGLSNDQTSWKTEFSGMFAPRSDNYQLTGMGEKQWYSAIAPSEDYIYSYRQQSHTRNIFCVQQDGANLPYSLPINIWTMQCLMNESQRQTFPFSAKVSLINNQITLELTNHTSSPITKGYVLFAGNEVLRFDSIEANASRDFSGPSTSFPGWGHSNRNHGNNYYRYNYKSEKETVFFAPGCLQRTQAIQALLSHGAAVVCVEYEQAPISYSIKNRSSNQTHTQLARLVVYPTDIGEDNL